MLSYAIMEHMICIKEHINIFWEDTMKAYCLILSLLFFVALLSATVWHVNSVTIPTGAPNVLRDFTDLQTANNSSNVVNGDTLYIYAGNYSSATITKKLTIIGTGYFLSENPETQFNQTPSNIDGINFATGSEYSVLTGVSLPSITVQANDITIKRCKIEKYGGGGLINIISSYRTIILQNYIHGWHYYWYDSPTLVNISGDYPNPISGIQIKNNILFHDNNTNAIYSSVACLFENNVVQGTIDVIGANVNNNIQLNGSFNGHETTIFMNNLCNSTQFAPDNLNGNKCNIDITGQVLIWSGTTDGRFQLRPGSPAIGAGLNGIDCGAFGGGTSYVLSGMPSEIPSVWFFESSYEGYTYPFHIKAKSHK
jgi:hypothetical protein